MYKYAIGLKPVIVAGGIEGLEDDKKAMFGALIGMLSKFFESTPEIDKVEVTEDYTMILNANKDVWDVIHGKLGQNAVVSRL